MCGIAGKLSWSVRPDLATVVSMCNAMEHRGPDDSGTVSYDEVILGHRRLSILDLSARASQPMVAEGGRYAITYNGEVYNFRELRGELEEKGHIFSTTSDTEVVLCSFIEWGRACVEKFNGMFAFAVWDDREKELFLARDRFGQKPLYYQRTKDGGISFASELKALLMDPDVDATLSYEGANCYLALGYILAPLTCYENVFKLEHATWMRMTKDGQVETKHYWDYSRFFRQPQNGTEDEIAEEIAARLRDSVRLRMISDVPVGALLSGGIDSSAIVAIMESLRPGSVQSFSMGFDEDTYCELADAARVAGWFGTHHHEDRCIGNGELLSTAVNAFGEPFADTSLVPMYKLCEFASDHLKVCLSGDGADELFAGYETYRADRYYSFFRWLPLPIKKLLSQDFSVCRHKRKLGWFYKLRQFSYGLQKGPKEAHCCWRVYFRPEERVAILGDEYRELVYDTDPFRALAKLYEKVSDLDELNQHLFVDSMTWLVDDILVKVDRASMAHSLEIRSPFLDVRLAEFVAGIAGKLKLNGLQSKYILRRAMDGILPEFVFSKRKSGFNAPVGKWLGTENCDEFRSFNEFVWEAKTGGAR